MRPRFLAALLILTALAAGCGVARRSPAGVHQPTGTTDTPALQAHPQAIDPVAGAAPPGQPSEEGPASVAVGPTSGPLPQPVSDAEIRRELAASRTAAAADHATLTPNGLAVPPADAPPVVQEIIAAGNQIAHLPYRFGGGHATFFDNAYDCSGSLSFVFGAAGLLDTPVTSGQLMSWGEPGPGRWITVFANAGHTFMYVAGLRFDTVALAETGSRWSNRPADEGDLASFAVRHPAGY